jgi:beta-1,2-mannobiose phosphorylase / 1,2-beta-oligomannan phosphorylase
MTVSGPPYELERLGVVMEADPADPREAWGVLNPACARGRDGELHLFPRIVADGNYSRIGRARVLFDREVPAGVERLGIALEPEEPWERNPSTAGVEDPRITFIGELDLYLMTYTAYGPAGPRIALASSRDLGAWERLGPAAFASDDALGRDLELFANKDAVLFPERVPRPDGEPAFALLHRPMWDLYGPPAIWVSFATEEGLVGGSCPLFSEHRLVARPERAWEALKIGAGTPPLRTPEGWLLLYHGVSGRLVPGRDLQAEVRYAAGAMVIDADDVTRVIARSREPLLEPETEAEREGLVANVVFPTAIDDRGDGTADVYYGMADSRIGAARLYRPP